MRYFLTFVLAFVSLFSAHAEDQLPSRHQHLATHIADATSSLTKEALSRALPAPRVAAVAERLRLLDVKIIAVADSPWGLGAYYPGVIIVDSHLNDETAEVIAFVLAHEYGHHIAGHWKVEMGRALALSQDKGIEDPAQMLELLGEHPAQAQSHKHEFEADAIAKQLLVYNNLWSPSETQRLFKTALKRHETLSHPASDARLEALHVQP